MNAKGLPRLDLVPRARFAVRSHRNFARGSKGSHHFGLNCPYGQSSKWGGSAVSGHGMLGHSLYRHVILQILPVVLRTRQFHPLTSHAVRCLLIVPWH